MNLSCMLVSHGNPTCLTCLPSVCPAQPGAAPPADFDSLLEALTSARWVSGQPVSADTLRAAVALRRDAFALRRAHQAALVEAEGKKT